MAKWIGMTGMALATIAIFFGFFFLDESPQRSYDVMTAVCVGVLGFLSFVRHCVFHRSDAERLGWKTDRPDWMFEVGFANLAFGIAGIVGVAADLGAAAEGLILLSYAIYLIQAGLWHGWRYLTDPEKSPARLWRSCISTLLFAGMMTYFALHAMSRTA